MRCIRRALFFIELGSRGGASRGRDGPFDGLWVTQQARNLLMDLGDRVDRLCLLIRDRDAKFVAGFDTVFTPEQITTIRTPILAPRPNAVVERWIGTVSRECTDRILILGRRHLTAVLVTYLSTTTPIDHVAHLANDHPTDRIRPDRLSRCHVPTRSEA